MVVQEDESLELMVTNSSLTSVDVLKGLFIPWLVKSCYTEFIAPSSGNIYFTAHVHRVPAEMTALAYFKETHEGISPQLLLGLPSTLLEKELSQVFFKGSVTPILHKRFYRTVLNDDSRKSPYFIATFGDEWNGMKGTCWGVYGYILKD
jgi:hypothetical protein